MEKNKLFAAMLRITAMRSIAIAALVTVIGFSFAALSVTGCPTSGGDSGSPSGSTTKTSRYTGVNSSNLDAYELVITNSSGSPQTGDSYVLTYYATGGGIGGSSAGKKSSGTITVSGSTITLSNGTDLIATVSGGSLTGLSGTIKLSDGSTKSTPGTLIGVKDGGDGTLNGTWKKSSETVKFNGSTFSYTDGSITAPGTAAYGGGFLVTYGTYGGDAWLVAGKYTLESNTIKFADITTNLYSGNWVKQ
jgi:hypothetical protein